MFLQMKPKLQCFNWSTITNCEIALANCNFYVDYTFSQCILNTTTLLLLAKTFLLIGGGHMKTFYWKTNILYANTCSECWLILCVYYEALHCIMRFLIRMVWSLNRMWKTKSLYNNSISNKVRCPVQYYRSTKNWFCSFM